MTVARHRNPARGLASLRRFAAREPARERCDLCSAAVADEHQHLVDPENRRLLCACDACAILFGDSRATRYRRVPRDVRELTGLKLSDVFWNGLSIPIGLVFFFRSSASGKMLAVYPSLAGPTETELDEELWRDLAALHPALQAMRPDIEALLVNRMNGLRDYYLAPVDECYKLTGLIRRYWRGLSGGDQAWGRIWSFFSELKRRSRSAAGIHFTQEAAHA
jgi:hypothetical protein